MFCSVKHIGYSLLSDLFLHAVFSMYHNSFNDYGLSNFFHDNPQYQYGMDFTRTFINKQLIANYIESQKEDYLIAKRICDSAEITLVQLVDAMMVHYGLWGDHMDGWSDV